MVFLQNLVLFLLMITVLVFVHEFGHYYFAKRFGVFVEKFCIGFGKPIFAKKDKKGTIWSIAPIPLGGFVKMKGEMVYSQATTEPEKDSFNSKTLLQKTIIVAAGPFINLVFGFLLFVIVGLFVSAKQYLPVVGGIAENTPAYNAKLQINDKITKINGINISTWGDISKVIAQENGKELLFEVERGNKNLSYNIKPIKQQNQEGERFIIGISYNSNYYVYKDFSLLKSLQFSYNMFIDLNKEIISWLKRAFLGNVSLDEVGGPVKIAEVSGQIYKESLISWLFFVGVFSINLAIINLLPIPALDGGHLMFYAIEALTKRKVPARVIGILTTASFVLLMSFMIFITFRDILQLF